MFKKTLHLHTAIFFMTVKKIWWYSGLLYSYLNCPYFNVLFDKISLLKPSIGIFMLHSFPKVKYMYMYWDIIMFTCLYVYGRMQRPKGYDFFFIIKYRLSHLYHEYIYWYIFELLQSKKVKCHAVYPSLWKKTYR